MIIAPGEDILSASKDGDTIITYKSGTSMAAPFVAGVIANFVGYEGISSDVKKTWKRLQSNQINNIISGFPTGSGQGTINAFLNNGMRSPNKRALDPYNGIPGELKLATAQVLDADTNVTDPDDTLANDNITDTAGPTATLTCKYSLCLSSPAFPCPIHTLPY
jgi:subtilisin family serine protease